MGTRTASRAVTAPGAVEVVRGLDERRPSLAAWYGEPLAAADAERLCSAVERALRSRLCAGLPVFPLQVQQLLGHYWLDVSIALQYRQLAASAGTRRERALLELVYGQLLMSRRRRPALQHLQRGFSLAADQLEATAYFLLVRRHDLLGHIPLSDEPAEPRGLQPLLAEAAVIRQLQGTERHPCSGSHQDTLG